MLTLGAHSRKRVTVTAVLVTILASIVTRVVSASTTILVWDTLFGLLIELVVQTWAQTLSFLNCERGVHACEAITRRRST
jgi:hypothetical protein